MILVFMVMIAPWSFHEGSVDEIFHDDFVALNLFLSIGFDSLEFVPRLWIFESVLNFINNLF